MKFTKVFFGDKRLKDVVVGASKFDVFKYRLVRFMRKVFIVSFVVGSVSGGYWLGGKTMRPVTVYADPVYIEKDAPVLDKIAKCESNDKHTGKSGQVLISANTNGTVDVGRYQINTVWFAKATELGLDLTKESDNKKMAEWIYANRGTEDWVYSKTCWQK